MQIIVKRIDNKFLFIKDGQVLYWGSFMTKKIIKHIKQLYRQEKVITEVEFKFRMPFKIIYKIKFVESNQEIILRYTSIFNPKFVCQYNDDFYEIIPHKSLKTSIFKNGKQVGYYIDKKVEYIGKQTLYLIANNDIKEDLIFTFILAIKCDFKNDYSAVSIDIGNIGPEALKFDTSWKPS